MADYQATSRIRMNAIRTVGVRTSVVLANCLALVLLLMAIGRVRTTKTLVSQQGPQTAGEIIDQALQTGTSVIVPQLGELIPQQILSELFKGRLEQAYDSHSSHKAGGRCSLILVLNPSDGLAMGYLNACRSLQSSDHDLDLGIVLPDGSKRLDDDLLHAYATFAQAAVVVDSGHRILKGKTDAVLILVASAEGRILQAYEISSPCMMETLANVYD